MSNNFTPRQKLRTLFLNQQLYSLGLLAYLVSFHLAFAMPCDTGYQCLSQSKRYAIEIATCRYSNSIHLLAARINGKALTTARLGAAFDGTYHDGPLDFEILSATINASSIEGSPRVLIVEIPAKSQIGVIRDIIPGQSDVMRVTHSELITCIFDQ